MNQTAPLELRFQRSGKTLFIRYDDGKECQIPYELLRVKSPSAEVQGHGGSKPPPLLNKREVDVISADPVGHYALRIHFDDGHSSGLFTWNLLRELGEDPAGQLAVHHGETQDLTVEAVFDEGDDPVR